MALEYGGPEASLLRELANIYRRLGERERAHRCLTKLVRVQPDEPELLEALARSHVDLGDFAAGLRTLASLVDLVVDAGARQQAREVLGRAERWSGDDEYTRQVDRLRVERLVRHPVDGAPTSPAPAPPTIPSSGLVVLGLLALANDDARCRAPV
jgi:predicted Zn-dependent protease